MNKQNNGGYSLIEVLIAIVLLGIVTVPTCNSLITAFRVNVKSEEMLKDQLAVSSAVETLMAEGITHSSNSYDVVNEEDRFPGVTVATTLEAGQHYYNVVVTGDGGITVETTIRSANQMPVESVPASEPPEGGGEE